MGRAVVNIQQSIEINTDNDIVGIDEAVEFIHKCEESGSFLMQPGDTLKLITPNRFYKFRMSHETELVREYARSYKEIDV